MTADDAKDSRWEFAERTPGRLSQTLPWPWPPWILPLVLGCIYAMWWNAGAREFEAAAADVPARALRAGLWIGLASRVVSQLAESAWYSLFWRGRGVRIGILRLFTWIAALSLLDLAALAILHAAAGAHGSARTWAALFAGSNALGADSPLAGAGVRAAFGAAGALCALRIAGTAHAQARASGRGMLAPLLLTSASWLASRVTLAWAVELAQGRSRWP